MANQVYNQIASDEMKQFGLPLSVSAMSKLSQWPMLQSLGFHGHLKDAKAQFHGLGDFKKQMQMYSNTHFILKAAWQVIQQLVPVNLEVLKNMYHDPTLGNVGKLFQSIHGFGQVFGLSGAVLQDVSQLKSKVSSTDDLLSDEL
jgi:hypothetical protein